MKNKHQQIEVAGEEAGEYCLAKTVDLIAATAVVIFIIGLVIRAI
jgi:hypothetical protein